MGVGNLEQTPNASMHHSIRHGGQGESTVMDTDTCKTRDERFAALWLPLSSHLEPASAAHVAHYVDSGELEMAYESFVLSLIEEKVAVADDIKPELLALGKELGLDRESVFRVDFWQSAQAFLDSP